MDSIDNAIRKGYHLTSESWISYQTYDMFETVYRGKKTYIYGAGNLAPLFWLRYKNEIFINGVLDWDESKIGSKWPGVLRLLPHQQGSDYICGDNAITTESNKDSIVILVLSIRFYEDICKRLKELGFDNVFSMLIMECNNRRDSGELDVEHQSFYARFCNECERMEIFHNKIMIESGIHGEHGRAITKALLNDTRRSWNVVWIVNSIDDNCPTAVRMVTRDDKYILEYELSTSHIVLVDTVDFSTYLRKRKGQVFIQLKHWSSITLKRFGLEDAARISEQYYNTVLRSSELTDYLFTGSDFDDSSCGSGFGKDIPCIRVGSPRSDILFVPDNSKEIRSKVGSDTNKHIIMYAPTFRTGNDGEAYSPSTKIRVREITESLTKCMGGEWEFWLRLHPLIQKGRRIDYTGEVINVSDYPSVQELVAAVDVLITDYSSVMFEPAFVYKPVFLFAPDRDVYVNIEKELLIEYDSLPFPIATNNQQLSYLIERFDEIEYHATLSKFFDKYGVHEDGHASERAVDFIISLCGEELNG